MSIQAELLRFTFHVDNDDDDVSEHELEAEMRAAVKVSLLALVGSRLRLLGFSRVVRLSRFRRSGLMDCQDVSSSRFWNSIV